MTVITSIAPARRYKFGTEGGSRGLILVSGTGVLWMTGLAPTCCFVLILVAGEGQCMTVFEVEGRKLESSLVPLAQPDQVLQLLLSEEHIQHTLQHHVLLLCLSKLLPDDLLFLLVLTLPLP